MEMMIKRFNGKVPECTVGQSVYVQRQKQQCNTIFFVHQSDPKQVDPKMKPDDDNIF